MAMKKKPVDPGYTPAPKRANSSADASRKTKQAQSAAMEKVKKKAATSADRAKNKSSIAADSKRKTSEAISVMGKKKAPSSYALGLLDSQKKKKAMTANYPTAAQLKPAMEQKKKKKKSRP
jgi:hypothetical protein